MEEIEDVQNEKKEVNVELIYYLDDEEVKKGYLKFNYDKEMISYNDITKSFYSFLKENHQNEIDNPDEQYFYIEKNNIIYESIRYFDGDGWIILRENEVIFIDEELTLNNLKIMIYCDIISEKEINIKKKYNKIDKEINYIYNQINKDKNYNLTPDAPLNLIVLTANPLIHCEEELRIINEFNKITSEIYNCFYEEDYLKYTKFWPLTFETLKNVITDEQKRPVILHLICKSTYIIPEQEKDRSENSEDYTNLIFEDDNNYYHSSFINKRKLEEDIFNYNLNPELEKNVNKIILIISTPLAQDVYNIFKKFGFKNIIIQHTTLADLNYIADINYTFYKDIITHLPQPINNLYEDALNCELDSINPPTFCCCFHKHKTTCDFFKNLKNELYNTKERKKLKDFKELTPHLYHLYPDCYQNLSTCKEIYEEINLKKINSFCYHTYDCFFSFKNLVKKDINKKGKNFFINFCCCQEAPEIHNINSVFITDFSSKEKNNEIRFRNSEIMRENPQYTPNYEKMLSIIGNNEVIFKVLEFFSSKDISLNIYGDNIENLKKFGDVIIEYYLERYYFFKSNKLPSNIIRIKSAINFKNNLIEYNSNDNIQDNELHSIKSTPLIRNINEINFVQINLNDDYIDTSQKEDKINNNNIYVIYVHDLKLKDKIKIKYNKIVWFSEQEDLTIQKRVKFNKEPILKKYKKYLYIDEENPNEYIKLQNIKIVRNFWRRKTE